VISERLWPSNQMRVFIVEQWERFSSNIDCARRRRRTHFERRRDRAWNLRRDVPSGDASCALLVIKIIAELHGLVQIGNVERK
jgi:hypothetical protein